MSVWLFSLSGFRVPFGQLVSVASSALGSQLLVTMSSWIPSFVSSRVGAVLQEGFLNYVSSGEVATPISCPLDPQV